MNTLISCLDHGFVRLVSYTQPVNHDPRYLANCADPTSPTETPDGNWTGDLEVIRSARVSHNADWRTGQDKGKDEKLIHYLTDNHHTSPFESMVFTFEIKAPIFVFRQWHRHRTWSYNEVSARYTELPREFYVPNPEFVGKQSTDNKQARQLSEETTEALANSLYIRDACLRSMEAYEHLLAAGVPRELARGVLPVNTYSRMFATVDLHNLFRFLHLRLHLHAQYEIRVYAQALLKLIQPICPVSVNYFMYPYTNS